MSTSTSYRRVAPADHFSPARAQLGELTRHVASLRKAMPLRSRLASGAHFGVVSAAAAIIAYIPTRALGLSQDFWSAITAIAVVQSEFHATQTTARDQFLGAALGGIAGLVTLLSFGQHLAVYAVAVIAAVLTCSLLNVASAGRLAGITATIILLVPQVGSPFRMFFSRLIEVGWGVLVAVSVVWLAARRDAQR